MFQSVLKTRKGGLLVLQNSCAHPGTLAQLPSPSAVSSRPGLRLPPKFILPCESRSRCCSLSASSALGASRGLQETVKESLQSGGISDLQEFHMLLPASVLLSTDLFISVRAVAINSMIKKSHSSESMR